MRYLTGFFWQEEGPQTEKDGLILQQMSYGKREIVLACIGQGEKGCRIAGQFREWFSFQGIELCKSGKEERVERHLSICLEKMVRLEREQQISDGRIPNRQVADSGRLDDRKIESQILKNRTSENRPMENRTMGNRILHCQTAGNPESGCVDQMVSAETSVFQGILIVDRRCWLLGSGRRFLFNRRFLRTHIRRLDEEGLGGICEVTGGYLQGGVGILLATEGFGANLSDEALRQCLASQDIVKEEQIERRLCELAEEGKRKGGATGSAIYIKSV